MINRRQSNMIPLPIIFIPGPFDVICGRGKDTLNHEGNKRYKNIVNSLLQKYASATNKFDKTLIVSEVIETVRYSTNHATADIYESDSEIQEQQQQQGQFVKKCDDGRWYEVQDHLIREKVSQGFRDSLHKLYKSSTKSKRRRRDIAGAGMVHDIRTLICSNVTVSSCLDNLDAKMNIRGKATPDMFAATMFNQTNMDMLEAFKRDTTLLMKFRQAEEQQKGETQ